MRIQIDLSQAITDDQLLPYQERVTDLHQRLLNGQALGAEATKWVHYPMQDNTTELQYIQTLAAEIQTHAEVLVVCGIGGSYLGSRAAIEMVQGLKPTHSPVEVIYLGYNLSNRYTTQIIKYLSTKSFYVNVISKSGSTVETAIAFRILKDLLIQKYSPTEVSQRIIVTTDPQESILLHMARQYQYRTLVVPPGIGGRFSVTTAVGLLPLAVSGIDILEIRAGAQEAYHDLQSPLIHKNPAYAYACARRIIQEQEGKNVEMFISYEPQLQMIAEWWKQLFGESEGKNKKGILPTSSIFSTDLHSIGQFIQDGTEVLFETTLLIADPGTHISFGIDTDNFDGINYLAHQPLSTINHTMAQGVIKSHSEDGTVKNIILTLQDLSPRSFGYLAYFMFRACAISTALLDVNPFDEPAVKIYKRNILDLFHKKDSQK